MALVGGVGLTSIGDDDDDCTGWMQAGSTQQSRYILIRKMVDKKLQRMSR